MADVLGTRLGRYEIRERLGRGGMATVYKAWDVNLDRWVAVKVLHDHLADEADFKQRFEREAKLVAALSHPNIVQIFDFDQTEINNQPVYYMVMAFINGPSLRQIMEQKTARNEHLSPDEIAHVIESVCQALAYAHQQGMVHRDVTPGNILFNENGNIVLADFGLARLVSGARLTQTGMTTGTPIYMSPEQGMGMPGDMRSDLYSLGVILYEMLSGQAPYSGDSAYAIIMQHVNDPLPPLKPLSSTLSAASLGLVIGRALAKDPDDRYQSANAFLAAFESATNGALSTSLQSGLDTVTLSGKQVAPKRKNGEPGATQRQGPSRLLIGALLAFGLVAGGSLFYAAVVPKTASSDVIVTLRVLPTVKRAVDNAMTDSSVFFAEDFSKGTHKMAWVLESSDSVVKRTFTANSLDIQNSALNLAVPTVINPRSASYGGAIVIEADLALSDKGQPASATGLVFRYDTDDHYYVFAFDGQNRVSIWLRKDGAWKELRGLPKTMEWTPTDGINPAGTKNHLKLIVDGDHLQGFINNHGVIDIQSPTDIDEGGVGIYLATTTNSAETSPFAAVDITTYSVQPYMSATPTTPARATPSIF